MNMGHPVYQLANPYHTAIHAQRFTAPGLQRTVIYGVVIVSRNLERTNENDGFKMTAL